jgi:glutathionylspermidine synthase
MAEPYLELAARLTATGIVSDPWIDGRPRFRQEPLVISRETDRALRTAAEAVAELHDEAAQLCLAVPSLLEQFFHLTPFQRLMWQASAPAWHGIARADVFLTADGPRVCELNSDTPSGEAEAVLLNALSPLPEFTRDPNAGFEARFCRMLEVSAGREAPFTVGILYPTELVEDLSMILLYQRWFAARGWRVILGAPFNLRKLEGRPALFGVPCDVFVRHYKTDWWGEREPVWRDSPPFNDAEPLAAPLGILCEGVATGACAVVNPFGAVVTQNKRLMALMWEAIGLFTPESQQKIRDYIPYTARLESLSSSELADRAAWVLKSDYGCESAEVILGADCSDVEWQAALAQAVPRRFVAQRRFVPIPDSAGQIVNWGVYVVGGASAGYFSRVHRGATDYSSLTAPTFIEDRS